MGKIFGSVVGRSPKFIKNGMHVYYEECISPAPVCRDRCWCDSTGLFYCGDPVRRILECVSLAVSA
jgi:hypothetical protein